MSNNIHQSSDNKHQLIAKKLLLTTFSVLMNSQDNDHYNEDANDDNGDDDEDSSEGNANNNRIKFQIYISKSEIFFL